MIFVTLFFLASTANAQMVVQGRSQLFLNYGLVLKQIDSFDVVSDTWLQNLIVVLPQVNESVLTDENIDCSLVGNADGCAQTLRLVRYLRNVSQKAVREIDRTLRHIKSLIGEVEPSEGRATRSLFNIIGQISKGLFGTATQRDVDSVKQMMQRLKQREDSALAAWQQVESHLSSFGKAVNHRLDTMSKMIDTQRGAIHDLFRDVMTVSSNQDQIASVMALALGRLEDFVVLSEQ